MKTTEARRSLEHSGRRRTQGFRPQAEAGRWEHPADSLVSDSSSWRQSFPRLLPGRIPDPEAGEGTPGANVSTLPLSSLSLKLSQIRK
ncbi:unnamed protein product [Caretta caretta]